MQVSQTEPVLVVRVVTKNSHDQYRDSKQTDKAVVDLASRSFSSEVQNLLVDLLNKSNKYVKEAHESQRGHEILKEKNFLPTEDSNNSINVEFDEETGGRLAITVQDPLDLDLDTVTNPTPRKRLRPDRFADTMLQDDVYQEYGQGKRRKLKGKASMNEDVDEEFSDQFEEDSSFKDSENEEENDDEESEVISDDSDDAFQSDGDGDEITALKDIVLETTTTKKSRQNYSKLTSIEQEQYNQDEMNFRYLLSLSPTRIYTVEDMDDIEVLDRALRLLFHARFGQDQQYMRIS